MSNYLKEVGGHRDLGKIKQTDRIIAMTGCQSSQKGEWVNPTGCEQYIHMFS